MGDPKTPNQMIRSFTRFCKVGPTRFPELRPVVQSCRTLKLMNSQTFSKKVATVVRVRLRPWSVFYPLPRTVQRISTFFEQLKTRRLIRHLPKMIGNQIRTIILEPPKCGSTTVRRELIRILGDFQEDEGIVQVTPTLSDFRRFLSSLQQGHLSHSPEILILGHTGIEVFVRAGLRDVVDLDSCVIFVPTRNESSRFESAVEYCRTVRVIPESWTVAKANSWAKLLGPPNISANNVSLDWGPPIHFASCGDYVETARQYGELREYDISDLGNLISDVANRHGHLLSESYKAPRLNMRK